MPIRITPAAQVSGLSVVSFGSPPGGAKQTIDCMKAPVWDENRPFGYSVRYSPVRGFYPFGRAHKLNVFRGRCLILNKAFADSRAASTRRLLTTADCEEPGAQRTSTKHGNASRLRHGHGVRRPNEIERDVRIDRPVGCPFSTPPAAGKN